MATNNRAEVLRALADLLEAHPEVEMPAIDSHGLELTGIRFQLTSHGERAADTAALAAKALPGEFRKLYSDGYFFLFGEFHGAPVKITALREDVCVARQVGTTTKQVKDPAALKLVPEIAIEVPVYEYDCKPILAKVAS